jgi:ABC-type multidrug transport system ATPase subunit
VQSVSVNVPPQSIYGLLGANGAGKTTIMRLMTGLVRPAAGTVFCLGKELTRNRAELSARIGSLIEAPSLYHHLTGTEHLRVFAEYTSAARGSVDRSLALVDLQEAANRKIATYSLGMKQRLALATALLHDPQILILDEPMNGLDPMGIVRMRDLMSTLTQDEGKTIVVSSHLLSEIEKMTRHVGVIHEGTMRFEGTVDDLRAASGMDSVLRLRVSSRRAAETVLGIASSNVDDGVINIRITDETDAAKAIARLVTSGVDVYEAVRESSSLERDFLTLVEEASNVE